MRPLYNNIFVYRHPHWLTRSAEFSSGAGGTVVAVLV